jgi:hypothetical protein
MSYRAWRAVHWLSYASWPVALWHGLGTGTDSRVPWLLALYALCGASVLGVAGWRLARTHPGPARKALIGAAVVVPLATIVFVATGPLRPGWARRAGTPVSLLGARQTTSSLSTGAPATSSSAPFTGQVRQARGPAQGQVTITVDGRTSGSAPRSVTVVLHGIPDGAGIAMASGTVLLGGTGQDPAGEGPVTHLDDHQLTAVLHGSGSQRETAQLHLVITGARAAGRLSVTPGGEQ